MFKNVKNPAFKRNAMILLVLGILMYYVFCVTVGEQISILATYLSAETGWNPNAIVLPITYAGILSIAFTFLCNTAFMKFNAKHVIVGATAVVGVGFALIGLSSTILNFTLFFATLFVIRSIVTFLNNGCNYLCGNWFSENRGKALGVVTIGGPLSSATFIALATFGVNSSLGFSGIYYIIGALIVVMAIVMGIFLKNSPEEIGAYPDGADKPSQALPDQQKKEPGITITALLKRADTWLLVLSFGLLVFGSGCITAFFTATMIAKGVTAGYYLPALTVGAIIGMPISYILGMIDDKFGTVKASLCLCALYVVCFLGIILTNGNNILTIIIATIGMAGVTGGAPILTPSINFYVFGQKDYLAATRVIGTLQSIIGAFAVTFIAAFVSSGRANTGYTILIGFVAVAAVALMIIGKLHPNKK